MFLLDSTLTCTIGNLYVFTLCWVHSWLAVIHDLKLGQVRSDGRLSGDHHALSAIVSDLVLRGGRWDDECGGALPWLLLRDRHTVSAVIYRGGWLGQGVLLLLGGADYYGSASFSIATGGKDVFGSQLYRISVVSVPVHRGSIAIVFTNHRAYGLFPVPVFCWGKVDLIPRSAMLRSARLRSHHALHLLVQGGHW